MAEAEQESGVFRRGRSLDRERDPRLSRRQGDLFPKVRRTERGGSGQRLLFPGRPWGFYRFYREHLLFPEARPNPAHRALARWEAEGRISAVITQNVDGLHQAAGSRKVFELHGSAHRNHCLRCGKNYDMDFILHSEGVPHCPDCGGVVKPDVTLFGEALPPHVFEDAAEEVSRADLLIVGGTSLAVYPAASLLGYFERGKVALINLTATEADSRADLVCRQPIGAVLQEVDELLHA